MDYKKLEKVTNVSQDKKILRWEGKKPSKIIFDCDLLFSVCDLCSFHFVPLFIENNLADGIFPCNQLLSYLSHRQTWHFSK